MDDNPWAEKKTTRPRQSEGTPTPDAQSWEQLIKKKRGSGGGGGGPNWTLPPMPPALANGTAWWAAVAILVVWLLSGFFHVQEGDAGLVLRFGKLVRVVNPGLRYRFPAPFEEEIIVRVSVWNKIDGGASSKSQGDEQSLILTTDENMVHVNYTVMWKINDVVEFLFNGRDPENTIRLATESAIREVIGQSQARLVLTEDRERIGIASQELLQKILDQYKIGVQIMSVQLQRVEPPLQVIEAFNDMQASLIDADRSKNEAEAYKNDRVPRARGEAQKLIQDATAYKDQVLLKSQGEVARFNSILEGARGSRDVAYMMLFSRMVPALLAKMNKTIMDSKASNGILPYMNIPQPTPAKAKEPAA